MSVQSGARALTGFDRARFSPGGDSLLSAVSSSSKCMEGCTSPSDQNSLFDLGSRGACLFSYEISQAFEPRQVLFFNEHLRLAASNAGAGALAGLWRLS
jgi:hypothetical protein